MTDLETVDERLRAVERALTDDDSDLTDLRDAAELTREVERLAGRLGEAEERLDELDAATQALRGYVGNVRAVNESVERRADAALATAEEVQAVLNEAESEDPAPGEPRRRRTDRSEVESSEPTLESPPAANARCPECNRARPPDQSESDDAGLLARIAEALW